MKKRTFGAVEIGFDVLYLLTVLFLGGYYLFLQKNYLAGAMAWTLLFGDSFHLIPRIRSAAGGDRSFSEKALGWGKMLTSIGMTVFYLLLWQLGASLVPAFAGTGWTAIVYALALLRIVLCLMPQNKWGDAHPPARWNLLRNIPFVLLGGVVAVFFFLHRGMMPGALSLMWLGVVISFGCYLPVVFGAKKYSMLGMLMLPKSCAYVWMLLMAL